MAIEAGAVRLVLLVVLGLVATGWMGLVGGAALGGLAAVLLHWLTGWQWIEATTVGVGGVLVLPILYRFLVSKAGVVIGLGLALFVGVPVFLISRFAFGSPLPFAVGDTICLMVLVPSAAMRVMRAAGWLHEPAPFDERVFRTGAPSTSASSPITIRNWNHPW